jgi:hypothetical protein
VKLGSTAKIHGADADDSKDEKAKSKEARKTNDSEDAA